MAPVHEDLVTDPQNGPQKFIIFQLFLKMYNLKTYISNVFQLKPVKYSMTYENYFRNNVKQ